MILIKIRISGTRDECLLATEYYKELEKSEDIRSVTISKLYPNRGSNTIFRLYVDIEYKSTTLTEQLMLETYGGRFYEKK